MNDSKKRNQTRQAPRGHQKETTAKSTFRSSRARERSHEFFGTFLQETRDELCITQEKLAELAELHENTVKRVEAGKGSNGRTRNKLKQAIEKEWNSKPEREKL